MIVDLRRIVILIGSTLLRFQQPLRIGCIVACSYIFFLVVHGPGQSNPAYTSALLDSTVACHGTTSCNGTVATPGNHSYAFFSSLWNAEYLPAALVLGHSLQQHHSDTIPRYLMVKPQSDLTPDMICQLETVGWTIWPVDPIAAAPIQYVKTQFKNNFTKLQLWQYTQFDAIVFLDADTLVRDRVDELFALVDKQNYNLEGFEFAAAPDNYGQWSQDFNTGVMVIRPSLAVYEEIIRLLPETEHYNVEWAEQGFLNEYFRFRYIRLPEQYHFNLAFVWRHRQAYRRLEPDLKIMHFTISKPWRFLRIEFEASAIWRRAYEEMKKSISFTHCA